MVRIDFHSFGKLKLIVTRLSQVTSIIKVCMSVNPPKVSFECKDASMTLTDVVVITDDANYVGCFECNAFDLHTLLKRQKAYWACSLVWDDNVTLKIITVSKAQKRTMKTKHRSRLKLQVSPLKYPISAVSVHQPTTSDIVQLVILDVCIVLDNFKSAFENITLTVLKNKLELSTEESEYIGYSYLYFDTPVCSNHKNTISILSFYNALLFISVISKNVCLTFAENKIICHAVDINNKDSFVSVEVNRST